ncbi:ABC transporter substrate-binding protein [Ancylobacter dichloromethanicus]
MPGDGRTGWSSRRCRPASSISAPTASRDLELLAALKPDLIVTTPYLAAIRPLLEGFAPTREFPVYAPPGGHPYALSEAATRSLGAAVGRTDEAEALIARAQAAMAQAGAGFVRAGIADRPVLAVNFLDTRHVRVYGSGSLFGDVMERTGLVNGWTRPSNYWGFSTVGIEELAQSPASSLLYLEPISVDTLDRLAASPVVEQSRLRQGGTGASPAAGADVRHAPLSHALRWPALPRSGSKALRWLTSRLPLPEPPARASARCCRFCCSPRRRWPPASSTCRYSCPRNAGGRRLLVTVSTTPP